VRISVYDGFNCSDTSIAISRLTCASFHEDQYGVVQRDIPQILELLLSFLSAIEEYYDQVRSLYVPPPPPDEQKEGDVEGEDNGNGVSEAAGDGKSAPKGWEERMRLQYEVEQSIQILGMMIDGTLVIMKGYGRLITVSWQLLKRL